MVSVWERSAVDGPELRILLFRLLVRPRRYDTHKRCVATVTVDLLSAPL